MAARARDALANKYHMVGAKLAASPRGFDVMYPQLPPENGVNTMGIRLMPVGPRSVLVILTGSGWHGYFPWRGLERPLREFLFCDTATLLSKAERFLPSISRNDQ